MFVSATRLTLSGSWSWSWCWCRVLTWAMIMSRMRITVRVRRLLGGHLLAHVVHVQRLHLPIKSSSASPGPGGAGEDQDLIPKDHQGRNRLARVRSSPAIGVIFPNVTFGVALGRLVIEGANVRQGPHQEATSDHQDPDVHVLLEISPVSATVGMATSWPSMSYASPVVEVARYRKPFGSIAVPRCFRGLRSVVRRRTEP